MMAQVGHRFTQRVAAFAGRLGLKVCQIRHIGKTRAEQTPAILGEALSPLDSVVAASGLAPLDDVQPVGDALAQEPQPVVFVGHLPFLARLTGFLVTGDPDRSVVRFRNGGIVCLTHEKEKETWLVSWVLTPEMSNV
ncbi:MAG: phosphohistidine phosphatase SixA [Chloroflexi bacterium]|nr:phosphohistidine phosphatase SixA [Chloroflexota bacterium]